MSLRYESRVSVVEDANPLALCNSCLSIDESFRSIQSAGMFKGGRGQPHSKTLAC